IVNRVTPDPLTAEDRSGEGASAVTLSCEVRLTTIRGRNGYFRSRLRSAVRRGGRGLQPAARMASAAGRVAAAAGVAARSVLAAAAGRVELLGHAARARGRGRRRGAAFPRREGV